MSCYTKLTIVDRFIDLVILRYPYRSKMSFKWIILEAKIKKKKKNNTGLLQKKSKYKLWDVIAHTQSFWYSFEEIHTFFFFFAWMFVVCFYVNFYERKEKVHICCLPRISEQTCIVSLLALMRCEVTEFWRGIATSWLVKTRPRSRMYKFHQNNFAKKSMVIVENVLKQC